MAVVHKQKQAALQAGFKKQVPALARWTGRDSAASATLWKKQEYNSRSWMARTALSEES